MKGDKNIGCFEVLNQNLVGTEFATGQTKPEGNVGFSEYFVNLKKQNHAQQQQPVQSDTACAISSKKSEQEEVESAPKEDCKIGMEKAAEGASTVVEKVEEKKKFVEKVSKSVTDPKKRGNSSNKFVVGSVALASVVGLGVAGYLFQDEIKEVAGGTFKGFSL